MMLDSFSENDSSDIKPRKPEHLKPFRFPDLPREIQFEVVQQLNELRDVFNLSLACKEFRNIFSVDQPQATAGVRARYVAVIDRYYSFLTTLHIRESDLVRPPPGGWPNITPENCKHWGKTDFVIDLLRHLPYIQQSTDPKFDGGHDYFNLVGDTYNSVDYSKWQPGDSYPGGPGDMTFGDHDEDFEPLLLYKHRAIISKFHDPYDTIIGLDTTLGEIAKEVDNRYYDDEASIESFFDKEEECASGLEMIFVPGHEPLWYYGELGIRRYDAQAMELQGPNFPRIRFGNSICDDMDWYWVRHLYRKHGWFGDGWKKEECLKAVREYVEIRMAGFSALT